MGASFSTGTTTSPARAITGEHNINESAITRTCKRIRSGLRHRARAVAEPVHPPARAVRDREQHIRERRALREVDVLAAPNLAAATADNRDRQRILVVRVA